MPVTILEKDNVVTLHTWSCPYFSLAHGDRGVCEMEQHMLQRALDARVTITERVVDGHAGCTFLIEQR